jgi:hypothetical protein
MGGWPIIETGSDSDKDWNMLKDSGTGNLVLMILYLVFIFGTSTGFKLYFAILIRF